MNNHEIDLSQAVWRKASYSNTNGGACVEVADLDAVRWAVRDSKDPAGPVLTCAPDEWTAFTASVRDGEFG